ncbi:hypothetical protein BU26DRAFT_94403 [Trematosphaeria pertusa]|uniref:Uncharacterized protein n=1 Tax=Trematosphaeria pertusa TaxID=390896 RepID=A0A6A6I1U6_9PLEO|nr:uncharacterized protein BU26DRAFT_94403 [Trematosphaeria pertusa]KAF2244119.1 hypothetical protein BU26DRAFT_94403 [Trematosphaeria pertusa]
MGACTSAGVEVTVRATSGGCVRLRRKREAAAGPRSERLALHRSVRGGRGRSVRGEEKCSVRSVWAAAGAG